MPSFGAGNRSHFNEMVGGLEHAHVMVHDHHGIAVRHQVMHHAEQPIHVRGMQANGRLVEHIQHAGGAVAHGTGELHTLAFTGRKRGAGAVKRQIAEAQIQQSAGHVQE